MGFWSKLGKFGLAAGGAIAAPFTAGTSLAALPAVLGAAGGLIGGAGDSAASSRGTNVSIEMEQERLRQQQERDFFDQLMARERGERESGKDALRSLQHTQYIGGGGREYSAPTTQSGRKLSTYGFGPVATTEAEQTGAQALEKELMARLQGGYSVPVPEERDPFSVPDKYRKPGTWEKIGNVAGPAASILSEVLRQRGTEDEDARQWCHEQNTGVWV